MSCEVDAAALEAAFRATIYRVELPEGRFDLRIGALDSAFDDCLRTRGVGKWGIITACNPGAGRLSNAENRLREAGLRERLHSAGWQFFAAVNLDATGAWPPEPGCLVLQIDEAQLRALAGEFSQCALVFGETGAAPCLLWLEGGLPVGVT